MSASFNWYNLVKMWYSKSIREKKPSTVKVPGWKSIVVLSNKSLVFTTKKVEEPFVLGAFRQQTTCSYLFF